MSEGDRTLIQHLLRDAEKHEQKAREKGDTKRAEYFRGVAAGFACTISVLEE